VFIDFDGTFADRGRVPAAHIDAVGRARENGHQVLLCTGRPRAMIPDSLAATFDGFVGAGGGYVEIDGAVLSDVRFPRELADRVVSVLTSHAATFLLEAPEAVYAPVGTAERLRSLFGSTSWSAEEQSGVNDIVDAVVTPDVLDGVSFGKVAIFHSATPVPVLADLIGPEVGALPNSITGLSGHSGEIYLRGVTKADGMAVAAAHLGVPPSALIAIGDGYNDLEMLAQAGTAVVVENSPEPVLALADHTIPGPDKGGVASGFIDLGLVQG
jgi:Cof subfamily protein (haloacid dehalogenase superfamily)